MRETDKWIKILSEDENSRIEDLQLPGAREGIGRLDRDGDIGAWPGTMGGGRERAAFGIAGTQALGWVPGRKELAGALACENVLPGVGGRDGWLFTPDAPGLTFDKASSNPSLARGIPARDIMLRPISFMNWRTQPPRLLPRPRRRRKLTLGHARAGVLHKFLSSLAAATPAQ